MKTLNFTPGPWRPLNDAGPFSELYIEQDPYGPTPIATLKPAKDTTRSRNITRANAALIAAAPDMYETLQQIAREGQSCDNGGSVEHLAHLARAALARVKKA